MKIRPLLPLTSDLLTVQLESPSQQGKLVILTNNPKECLEGVVSVALYLLLIVYFCVHRVLHIKSRIGD